MDLLPFRQARWFTPATGRNPRLIVLHTTEGGGTAASNQAMMATWDRVVSAHFIVGADGIAPCVHLSDVAFAAPGVNRDGIQIEQIGRAAWSRTEWLTQHAAVLANTSALLASLSAQCDIPLRFVDATGILAGGRGVTTHVQVTAAYPGRGSGHWDPGPGFPLDVVLADAVALLNPPHQEDDMSYLARLAGGDIVLVSGTVRPVSQEELTAVYAGQPIHDIPPGSNWEWWITQGLNAYKRQVV